MASIAAEIISQGAKVLLAMGGDGTLQTLVNAPGTRNVTIGILPTGTGNDFASALGLPLDPVLALQSILTGRICCADLARVRTADGRERLYCGGGGLGLDAEAARRAGSTYAGLAGKPRYVLSALHALSTFSPVTVRAEFPEGSPRTIEKRALVAAALNTPTYGAGLRLADKANIDDGLLDVVFVEELRAREVAGLVFDWARHRALRTPRISSVTARRVRLTAERPSFFHGDGEIIGLAPVEIEAVSRAIRVLAPHSGRSDLKTSAFRA